MSETFIKIDSLQHLEVSRQTYPTNVSKIMRTIHTSMTTHFSLNLFHLFNLKH